MNLNMGFGSSMDHGSLLRKLNPENELFSIVNILLLLRARVIIGLGIMSGGRIFQSSRLLYTTLPSAASPASLAQLPMLVALGHFHWPELPCLWQK